MVDLEDISMYPDRSTLETYGLVAVVWHMLEDPGRNVLGRHRDILLGQEDHGEDAIVVDARSLV